MKKIVMLFVMLIYGITLIAQKYDCEPFISNNSIFENQCENWEFSEIIQVDSTISKEQLFMSALEFLSSRDFNITISDKEGGKIFGKGCFITNREGTGGNFEKVYAIDGVVCFAVSVQCKDGRFKYIFTDYFHKDAWTVNTYGHTAHNSTQFHYGSLTNEDPNPGYGRTGRSKKCWISIKNEFKRKTYFLIQDLKKDMNNKTINQKNNW